MIPFFNGKEGICTSNKIQPGILSHHLTASLQCICCVRHVFPLDFHIGDRVKVLSINIEGTVHTLPNAKGDLIVTMGILNSQVNIKDLLILEENNNPQNKKKVTGAGGIKSAKTMALSTELNLIGMTVDEAIAHLDKYLDDAYLSHAPSVRIVHGKGSGALRTAVQNHLKRQKYVKSYRLGTFGEGDAGVTIVEFK